MPITTYSYDVFLSHSSRDKSIARQVAQNLRQRGIRVWFDEWAIQPGDSIPKAIEMGLEQSRVLVLAMSKSAFDSDWVTLERQAGLFRDPGNQDRRFIPIRLDNLENTQIPMMLRHYKHIDFVNEPLGCHDQLAQLCRQNSVETATIANTTPQPLLSSDVAKASATEKSLQEARQMLQDRLGEQFDVGECIDSDAHETLFRARDRVLQREVAIKMPNLPSCEAEVVASKFYNKMRAVSMINHHNVMPVFGGFRIDHLPILVIGYIPGVTVAELIEKTGAQPFRKIRQFLLDVGSALEYSHRRGAIHHRLRPSNILLDEDGNSVVTPMNFAHVETRRAVGLDSTECELERVSYDAPESFFRARENPDSSDQYSLGMIAYEMLIGDRVTDPSSYTSLVQMKQRFRNPQDPEKVGRSQCPVRLWETVKRMLNSDPEKRFETFTDLIEEVRSIDDKALGLRRAGNSNTAASLRLVCDSLNRCRVRKEFFRDFYQELLRAKAAHSIFEKREVDAVSSEKQQWLLREALELLIAYADEHSTSDRLHVLTRVAQTHKSYRLSPELYDHFHEVLLATVERHEVERFESSSRQTIETVLEAWKQVIRPGIDFLKKSCSDRGRSLPQSP